MIHRRRFLSLLGSAAAAWPGIARAQQPKQMKRVGVLIPFPRDDAAAQISIATFRQGLRDLGWNEGQDIQIDYRWDAHDTERVYVCAAELVRLAPDAIICGSNASVRALQRATSTIPIIFLSIADPIGAGFVASLARPGGNITGFTPFEHSMAGKWLELLREMAPNLRKIAVIQNPTNTAWASNFETITDQSVI
jgi:putative ABC transport system substrate-binding protein